MRLAWVLLFTLPLAGAQLELSLKRAVQLAISPEGNTRVQLSAEALKQNRDRYRRARLCYPTSLGHLSFRISPVTWRLWGFR